MNIFHLIKENCQKYNDKAALAIRLDNNSYRKYNYGKMLEKTEAYAVALAKARLMKGDRIALVAENSPEWVISFLSIISLECTAVLIDPALSNQELNSLIERSDVRGIMISPNVREKLPSLEVLKVPVFNIINDAEIFENSVKIIDKSYPATPDPDITAAAILYSSGTTSTAKGVVHTHKSIIVMAEKNIDHYLLNKDSRQLAVIPLYHIYGFMSKMICTLLSGASVCFIQSMTSENLSKALIEFKPTTFACVPRVFDMFKTKIKDTVKSKGKFPDKLFGILLAGCTFLRENLGINLGKHLFKSVHEVFGGSIQGFMSAGSALSDDTAMFFYGLGFCLFNNYGITETNIPITANYYSSYSPKTSGRPFKDIYIKIKNGDKKGMGEILVKSPGLMKGYFRDEVTTLSAFDEDGWFMTGDLGILDNEGNLTITGRLKENIVLATGKKVSPGDIEAAYEGILGISEFIVCGIPNNKGNFDEVHAFIVKDLKNLRGDNDIQTEVYNISSNLPLHRRITKIHFVSDIPKTALQKPKRYLLKAQILEPCNIEANMPSPKGIELPKEEYKSSFEIVAGVVSKLNFAGNDFTESSRLLEDLSFDSLTLTELCLLLEKETGRSIFHIIRPNLTIGEIVQELNRAKASSDTRYNALSNFPIKKGTLEKLLTTAVVMLSRFLYKIEVKGLNNLPSNKGYILCPNHETNLDPMLVYMFLPKEHGSRFCCMGKAELQNNIMGRFIMRAAGAIPVDRHGNPGPALKRCLEKLKEGSVILIHPEGTRTMDGKLGEFKKGASKLAIDSGLPIIPVRISGGYDIFPKDRLIPKLFNLKTMNRYKLSIHFDTPLLPYDQDTDSLTSKLKDRVMNLK